MKTLGMIFFIVTQMVWAIDNAPKKSPRPLALKVPPKKIVCHSPQLAAELVIRKRGVSFVYTSGKKAREIASVPTVHSKKTLAGLVKVVTNRGKKYTINIGDIYRLSPRTDAVTIRTPKGHEMTYPLDCVGKF